MRKILTYIILGIACILVVFMFVTATSYIQLAVAVILYPIVAYFAVKIFSNKARLTKAILTQPSVQPSRVVIQKPIEETQVQSVIDDDKRTFLKLVGATGIFFFVSSLLGKRVDSLLLGNALTSGTGNSAAIPSADAGQNPSGSLAANGYNITEIDDGAVTFYGFTNKAGAWLIMREDTDTSSFRYAKGDKNFPTNWTNKENLKYDYYFNLF